MKAKFRVWSKEHNKMFHTVCVGGFDDTIPTTWDEKRGWVCICGSRDQAVEMLSTGHTDKNNKEIYEGDIIKCIRWDHMDSGSCGTLMWSWIGVVLWDAEDAKFKISRNTSKYQYEWFGTLSKKGRDIPGYATCPMDESNEVLGNIYEDPDLIPEGYK